MPASSAAILRMEPGEPQQASREKITNARKLENYQNPTNNSHLCFRSPVQVQLSATGELLLLGRRVLAPLHHLLHHPHLAAHSGPGQAGGARG